MPQIFFANLGDPDLAEKLNKIKLKCETERKEAEAENSAGSDVKSLLIQMMGAVSHGGNKPKNKHDLEPVEEDFDRHRFRRG